jgi:hypothetical protein
LKKPSTNSFKSFLWVFAMQSANKNEPTPEEVAPASVTEKATTAAAYTVRVHN